MPTEKIIEAELRKSASEFLEALVEEYRDSQDRLHKIQRSTWWVQGSPTSRHTKEFERQVFDPWEIIVDVLNDRGSRRPSEVNFTNTLVRAGIPVASTFSGYIAPLVEVWAELPSPFNPPASEIALVLDEFCSAVFQGFQVIKSKVAFNSLQMDASDIDFGGGVRLRHITEGELWELGDSEVISVQFTDMNRVPSKEWAILDVRTPAKRGQMPLADTLVREIINTTVTLLSLATEGGFEVIPLGGTKRYGLEFPNMITERRVIGPQWEACVIDDASKERLQQAWPLYLKIYASLKHHLRLPSQRFVEARSRTRNDDAVIDYAIGLESLLTHGIRQELSYRFSLRGATILGLLGYPKEKAFESLKTLYNTRSKLAHGEPVDEPTLAEAANVGESTLRRIWWWYFERPEKSLKQITKFIDQQILN